MAVMEVDGPVYIMTRARTKAKKQLVVRNMIVNSGTTGFKPEALKRLQRKIPQKCYNGLTNPKIFAFQRSRINTRIKKKLLSRIVRVVIEPLDVASLAKFKRSKEVVPVPDASIPTEVDDEPKSEIQPLQNGRPKRKLCPKVYDGFLQPLSPKRSKSLSSKSKRVEGIGVPKETKKITRKAVQKVETRNLKRNKVVDAIRERVATAQEAKRLHRPLKSRIPFTPKKNKPLPLKEFTNNTNASNKEKPRTKKSGKKSKPSVVKKRNAIGISGQPNGGSSSSSSSNLSMLNSNWPATDFIVRNVLATGAFGTVKRAFSMQLNKFVAIKYIRKTARNTEILDAEYNLHKKMAHINITKMLGEAQVPGCRAFVMELCYLDFHDFIYSSEVSPRLIQSKAQSFIQQVVAGVAYLHHSHGYMHLDLKPENVVIASDKLDLVKVTDFGGAMKLVSPRFVHNDFLTTGTLRYRPPEILQRRGFDSTADVWAVGCIAYELLKGKHPFFRDLDYYPGKELGADQDTCQIDGALELMSQFRPNGLNTQGSRLSPDQYVFFRQVFCMDFKQRPLIRDLEKLTWLSCSEKKPFHNF